MDVDEEWAQQIRMRKFEIYNEEWMQAIEEDAQLEAYYDGGGDEADLEARIGTRAAVGFVVLQHVHAAATRGRCSQTWCGVPVPLHSPMLAFR